MIHVVLSLVLLQPHGVNVMQENEGRYCVLIGRKMGMLTYLITSYSCSVCVYACACEMGGRVAGMYPDLSVTFSDFFFFFLFFFFFFFFFFFLGH